MKRAAALLFALSMATGCRSRDPPPIATVAPADSLVALGEQIYRREEYDSARTFLVPAAERFRAAGDSAAEARALTWLGLAAWRLGDYERAREQQERALKLKLALGLERELWRSYNGLGLVAWNEGRLMEAIGRFGEATSIAERFRDSVALGSTAGNLGLVYTELGDFAAARRGFLRMRDIGRSTGNGRVEGNAHTNLGMLDIRVGNPSTALAHLTDALRLYQAVDYATGRQNALGQLGTAYAALGEPSKALAALDSALMQSRDLGLQQEEASNLEAIAEQYRVAGDYRRALELYSEAEKINRALGLSVEIGADLRTKAEIYAQLGDLDLAARNLRQALQSHRAAAARVETLHDELLLADVEDRLGRRRESDAHLAEALRLARAVDARIARVSAALGAARIADRRRDARRVVSLLDAAAADLAAGGYDTEWEGDALRARAMTRLGRLEEAVADGRKALVAVERVRGSYGSGLLRTSYIADRSQVYAELAAVLERLGKSDEAFEVSDGARGRALVEHAAARGGVAEARAATLAEIEGLAGQIERFTRRYDQADPHVRASIAELYERLGRARDEYERLVARGTDADPRAALLGAAPTRAADVRAALDSDEALIEYLLSSNGVVGFVVTRERIALFHSPVSAENLKSRVRLARDLLSRPDAGDAPVLQALHAALIAPARLPPAIRRLVVIPHGVLAYLPFAALRDERGRYLVESYSLVTVPSAMALTELRRRAGGGVAVGDAVVFAPFPERLPATAIEADALRRTFGAAVQTGGRASEARFRRALGTTAPVHAATHGVLNPHNPLFSRIEFASPSRAEPGDDGRLEVHEVLDLKISSPLVFLSGCETALGAVGSTDFARGEDFATLAQAFLYAGADNVVATLWRVEDDGAAAFAKEFYKHLSQLPAAEALAAAQRELLHGTAYRAPFYWAAYTVSGGGKRPAQERPQLSVRH